MLNIFLTVYFGVSLTISTFALIAHVIKSVGERAFRIAMIAGEIALIAGIWGVFG